MAYSSTYVPPSRTRAVLAAFMLPWNGFVAMFLYYVLLTMVSIGGAEPPALVMAMAYLLPVAGYFALLLNRGVQALVAMPIELGETPHALHY